MKRLIAIILALVLPLTLGAATAEAAAGATAKCEAAKMRASGKYLKCLFRVLAKNALKGPAPDFTRCDQKFMAKYAKIEAKAGLNVCPTEGDVAMVKAVLTEYAWAAAAMIGDHAPGYRGKKDFPTVPAVAWKDSDGVEPEEPGCHSPYTDAACDNDGNQNNNFGEDCEDQDILVETNPSASECHPHPGNVGRPERYSCSAYCLAVHGVDGICDSTVMSDLCPVGGGTVDSAFCDCS